MTTKSEILRLKAELDDLENRCDSKQNSDYEQTSESDEESDQSSDSVDQQDNYDSSIQNQNEQQIFSNNLCENLEDYKLNWVGANTNLYKKNYYEFQGNQKVINCQNLQDHEFFMKFITDDFINIVIQRTQKKINSKLQQIIDKRKQIAKLQKKQYKKPHSSLEVIMNKDNFLAVLGIMYIFGIIKKPTLQSYWQQSELFTMPGIAQIISRDKFLVIYRNLTFYEQVSNPERFHEVREIINHFHTVSNNYYLPGKNLAPDEVMTKFQGYDEDRQYMPSKPIRFGYKSQALADSVTGYLLKIIPYSKSNYGNSSIPFNEQVILDLVQDYKGKGHCLFLDGVYTSVQLFMKLSNQGFNACGSLAQNRLKSKQSKQLTKQFKKIKENEVLFYTDNNSKKLPILLSVSKQQNKKPMRILSTYHNIQKATIIKTIDKKLRAKLDRDRQQMQIEEENEQIDEVQDNRKKYDKQIKEGIKVNLTVSQQQYDYNNNMGGVDLFDQFCSYYMPDHRSYSKYFRISIHVLEMMLINSHILYKLQRKSENAKKIMNLHEYRQYIIRYLVSFERQNKDIQQTDQKNKRKFQQLYSDSEDMDIEDQGDQLMEQEQFGELRTKGGYAMKCEFCPTKCRWGCHLCDEFVCKQHTNIHLCKKRINQ